MTSECPICFDAISSTNHTITECGHTFHTNCLMTNVLHNGFGCPYCRTAMCEEPVNNEHSDSDSDEEYEDEDEDIETEDEAEIQDWLEQERIHRAEERAFANLRRMFTEEDQEDQAQN